MAAYNTSVRFISSCEGGNEAVGGAKGLEGVDFRCRFYCSIGKITQNDDGLDS